MLKGVRQREERHHAPPTVRPCGSVRQLRVRQRGRRSLPVRELRLPRVQQQILLEQT